MFAIGAPGFILIVLSTYFSSASLSFLFTNLFQQFSQDILCIYPQLHKTELATSTIKNNYYFFPKKIIRNAIYIFII